MADIDNYIYDNIKGMLETLLDREPTEEEIENAINQVDIENIKELIDQELQDAIENI